MSRPWEPQDGADGTGWGEWFCADPVVLHVFPTPAYPMGIASLAGPLLRDRPAYILFAPTWTIETPHWQEHLPKVIGSYLEDHPLHRVVVLTPSDQETRVAEQLGLQAVTINHNALLNEDVFRPLPDSAVKYDAVFNGRLHVSKRPNLAARIDRLAMIYFRSPLDGTPTEFEAELMRLQQLMPQADFFYPTYPSHEEINRLLAQSRVGLCLSPVEGAMRASMEFLMAGLPVVSTPSLGGRDFFFDDAYTRIVEPDAEAVRSAVQELIALNIPRSFVREQTLRKVNVVREQFVQLVQDIIDGAGGHTDFASAFYSLLRRQPRGFYRWSDLRACTQALLDALP